MISRIRKLQAIGVDPDTSVVKNVATSGLVGLRLSLKPNAITWYFMLSLK